MAEIRRIYERYNELHDTTSLLVELENADLPRLRRHSEDVTLFKEQVQPVSSRCTPHLRQLTTALLFASSSTFTY